MRAMSPHRLERVELRQVWDIRFRRTRLKSVQILEVIHTSIVWIDEEIHPAAKLIDFWIDALR